MHNIKTILCEVFWKDCFIDNPWIFLEEKATCNNYYLYSKFKKIDKKYIREIIKKYSELFKKIKILDDNIDFNTSYFT